MRHKPLTPVALSIALLLVCGYGVAQSRPGPRKTDSGGQVQDKDSAVHRTIQAELLKEFDAWLGVPGRYKKLVDNECRDYFPEGDLFPYVMPAMAYTNVALRDPNRAAKAVKRVSQLIDLVLPEVVRKVRPPGRKLENLKTFNKHATYLGQLNVVLGCYRLIGGDGRYDKIHKQVSDILHQGLVKRKGRPLESYPHYSWSFDTIPCLLSLQLYDLHTGQPRSRQVTASHLAWVKDNATGAKLRLPHSRINMVTGRGLVVPRGCDLSLRICMQWHIAPEYTRELYRNYVKSFWVDRGVLAGFAEWPGGKSKLADTDSGPIILGVGMSATGLGLGAAIACGDKPRTDRLCAQTGAMKLMLKRMLTGDRTTGKAMIAGMMPYRQRCQTGFVFGDACLFYTSTWTPWTKEAFAKLKATPTKPQRSSKKKT